MKEYILGSHNSWSFLRPCRWWQRAIAWTARCQRKDIHRQYALGVRAFDLRLRTDGRGNMWMAHGMVDYPSGGLTDDLGFLDRRGDCLVRVLHETRRTGKEATGEEQEDFKLACSRLKRAYPHICFYGGKDVRDMHQVYQFGTEPPTEDGRYASNMKPQAVDDWWPWLYAVRHNRQARQEGTACDVLVLDFVDIC